MTVSLRKAQSRVITVDGSVYHCTPTVWVDTFTFRHPVTNARLPFCTLSSWEDSMRNAIRERLTRA